MITPESIAINWTIKLLAFAIIFQTIELIRLSPAFSDKGVWRWSILKDEFKVFPKSIQNILDKCLRYPNFLILLYIRLVCAILITVFPHPLILSILFITVFLTLLRFRGTFNGGSDYMTLVVLSALTIASIFNKHEAVVSGALWYIAIQAGLSYFISGLVKINKASWRSGKALTAFVVSGNYEQPEWLLILFKKPVISIIFSWCAMLLECFFPLAFADSTLCLVFVSAAFIFHVINFYVFGLNRFVFAWLASYPALYYASGGFYN